MEKKPLIFLCPISETVQKLKESFEEQENVEIFEVDVLQEAIQIFQTSQPAVVLCSDPKKMIQFQAVNKRIIAKSSSKTVLITAKVLNMKAERKFSQLGLSDYIKEPIAGKTLYYKINLLVKSLPERKNPEDDNYNVKEGSFQEEQEDENDIALKKGKSKNQQEEDLGGYLKANIKDRKEEDLDISQNFGPKAAEDVKQGNLTGKSNYKEDDLGGNYEGEGEGKLKDQAGTMASKDSEKENASIEDLVGKSKTSLTDKEEDLLSDISEADKKIGGDLVGKSMSNLELSEEELEKQLRESLGDPEEINNPLKSTNLNLEEEEKDNQKQPRMIEPDLNEEKNKTNLDLLEDELNEGIRKKQFDEIEEIDNDSGLKSLDLQEDDELALNSGKTLEPEEKDSNGKVDLNLEEDEIDELKRDKKELGKKHEEQDRDSDYQELPMAGNQKGKSNTDNLNSAEMSGKTNFQEQEREMNGSLGKADQIENKDLKGKLDRQVQELGKKQKELESSEPELAEEKKKKLDLQVQHETDPKERTFEEEEQIAKDKKRALNKADDIDKYMRSPNLKKDKEEKEDKQRFLESEEETVAKKKGLQGKEDEFEDNWDFDQDVQQHLDDEIIPENVGKGMYAEDEDLGEQTIDYKKIKKAYEEGGSGDEAFSEEENAYIVDKTEEGVSGGSSQKQKQPYTFEVAERGPQQFEISEEPTLNVDDTIGKNNEKKNQVFPPDSKGFEYLVKRLNDYGDKGKSSHDIFYQVSKILSSEKRGLTTFFLNRSGEGPEKNPNLESWFSMHELQGDDDQDIIDQWNTTKTENINEWIKLKFPTWKDHTFQSDDNYFVFPFYDGIQFQGLAIITFTESRNEKDTSFIEVQLEAARGLYLDEFKQAVQQPKVVVEKVDEEETKVEEENKGFFSRLFKKAS